MSLILNIDSSLETASVSISQNGEILNLLTNSVQKTHAAFLHAAINELLAKNNLQPGELDAIASTVGPGSYTGLRVGLAAAKGLAYAISKPLISVGTLNAMAQSVISLQKHPDCLYCPLIDARRMEVYTALYNADMEELAAPHAAILHTSVYTEELRDKRIIFFGSGAEKFKNICDDINASFANVGEIITAINHLSYKKFKNKNFSDISLTIPLYTKDFFNK